MNKIFPVVIVLMVAALTSACEGDRSVFGEEKKAPDEFAVYSRAPLSLPPDFGLRPPKPGATRPQVVAPRNDARKALMGSSPAPATFQAADENMTPGMMALLKQAGADRTQPEIRELVNRETFLLSGGGDENFVDSILFWRKNQTDMGIVIDPAQEDRRLRAKKAEDQTVIDQTPTIQRRGSGQSEREVDSKNKGFWGSLFD